MFVFNFFFNMLDIRKYLETPWRMLRTCSQR